ncbi:MAG: serine/threonine-protein kinase, partial [Acidobacteriota bacterium]
MSSTELNRKLVEHIGPLLALDAAAQRLYIDEICAEEPRLRDDLEALAQEAGGLSDDFLETPASLLMGGDPATLGLELTPTPVPHIKRLGPYNILEVLGQGGMGTVFLGAQERPIRRRVAIKVIDGLNNPNRLERFAIECQALARLSHPNIASLHEVGKTEDGRPYVVMELIEGTVITEWCDEHRMSLGDRIELFLGVCAGIRHAHERGVLHRDLKPTNVLVTEIDGRAVAKVIDFGIACSLDDHTPIAIRTPTPTLERQLVGSPAYMSPEVARGERDLDTRSDVYSLGLLLYELIVGVSPFEPGDSLATLLRRLATEDRPSPTARLAGLDPIMQRDFAALRGLTEADLARRIGGDLDAIVCKAISRDREQRYSSASNLAADLERYLGHEPVTARPSTPSYLIGKFARRHRTVVATAAMVAASLVAGIVATSAALLRARQAEARAMQNFAKAQDVVDDFLTDVSENDLLQAPGAQPVRKSLLERALRYYEEFIAQHEKDASLRFDLARASVRVGRINDELGMQQNSLPAFERAIGLLEDLADQYPAQPEYRYHLADATHRAAWSYYHNGQAEKSFAVGLRTLTLQERLVEDYPEVFEYRELFARGLADHGEALEVTGQDRAAVEVAQRSLRLFQELDRAQATAGRYRTDLAEAYTRYGGFLYRVERFDEGLEAHRAALQIYRQQLPSDSANDAGLESLDPSHRTYQERYAKGLLSFGSTLLAKGQLPEAQDAFDEALSIWRR